MTTKYLMLPGCVGSGNKVVYWSRALRFGHRLLGSRSPNVRISSFHAIIKSSRLCEIAYKRADPSVCAKSMLLLTITLSVKHHTISGRHHQAIATKCSIFTSVVA